MTYSRVNEGRKMGSPFADFFEKYGNPRGYTINKKGNISSRYKKYEVAVMLLVAFNAIKCSDISRKIKIQDYITKNASEYQNIRNKLIYLKGIMYALAQ